jgi:hypothetical protein
MAGGGRDGSEAWHRAHEMAVPRTRKPPSRQGTPRDRNPDSINVSNALNRCAEHPWLRWGWRLDAYSCTASKVSPGVTGSGFGALRPRLLCMQAPGGGNAGQAVAAVATRWRCCGFVSARPGTRRCQRACRVQGSAIKAGGTMPVVAAHRPGSLLGSVPPPRAPACPPRPQGLCPSTAMQTGLQDLACAGTALVHARARLMVGERGGRRSPRAPCTCCYRSGR